ncbi:MAG: NYN domain-containing protein [Gammaproteobacteria bacterium]|nr:NYN domain-containing protein [Gammaproteobacteria bacterium]MDE0411074.1 NYN domain-containing protein [Gammaproteobacteria bacterium]
MPKEPAVKRAVSFFDGQNLFRHAKEVFGYYHPNYDPCKLAAAVCAARGWQLGEVRFYTGIPEAEHSAFWHSYWARRLTAMRRAGVTVISRRLRHRIEKVMLPDGIEHQIPVLREKGIDLRLGLDVVRMARSGAFDVAVIFSQDQDLAEVAKEVRAIAQSQGCWLKVVSAFPDGPGATSSRGIDGTDWFRMDRTFYNACLDPRDYRPPQPQ